VSLLFCSAFKNRKQHAIAFDQPQSRAIRQKEELKQPDRLPA
jgi:hypothetical protein